MSQCGLWTRRNTTPMNLREHASGAYPAAAQVVM